MLSPLLVQFLGLYSYWLVFFLLTILTCSFLGINMKATTPFSLAFEMQSTIGMAYSRSVAVPFDLISAPGTLQNSSGQMVYDS